MLCKHNFYRLNFCPAPRCAIVCHFKSASLRANSFLRSSVHRLEICLASRSLRKINPSSGIVLETITYSGSVYTLHPSSVIVSESDIRGLLEETSSVPMQRLRRKHDPLASGAAENAGAIAEFGRRQNVCLLATGMDVKTGATYMTSSENLCVAVLWRRGWVRSHTCNRFAASENASLSPA